jgi:hypothetical protein
MIAKPELFGGKMEFTQEADCCNEGFQTLDVEVHDGGGGKYILIKTTAWAFDSIEEFAAIIEQVRTAFQITDSKDGKSE